MKNNKKLTFLRNRTWLFIALIVFCLSSCKKEIVPSSLGNSEATGLNFYSASDVLSSYVTTSTYTAVYVDHYVVNPVFGGSLNSFPTFFYSVDGVHEFPDLKGGVFSYARYNAGKHQLMFADTTNTVVLDTTISFSAKNYYNLYFTDAQTGANSVAAYKMMVVSEERRTVPDGQVGVRFIHLSPDAGDLTVSLNKADGTETSLLPNALGFLKTTPYQYLDTSAVVSGLLRFTLSNSSNRAMLTTGVPFKPGKSYVVVISGFLNDQLRQVPAGKNPDGSIKYTSINITNNLRATLRRSY